MDNIQGRSHSHNKLRASCSTHTSSRDDHPFLLDAFLRDPGIGALSDSYIDCNLDWSFATLTPQMKKILFSDRITHFKKSTENETRTRSQFAQKLTANLKKLAKPKALRSKSFIFNQEYLVESALQFVNSWNFNIFEANQMIGYHIMLPVAKRIFIHHDLLDKFRIPEPIFDEFILKVERHYKHNAFHNSVHATDVMQTVNSIMVESGFGMMMDDLEILCILITALVHDIEHTGTNNNFHRNTRSEMAKLYMVSILENHHIRVALGILRLISVLDSLTETQYEEFKDMMCSMILSTDMTNHFLLVTNMKIILHTPSKCSSRIRIRRIMLLLLHTADISNPAKPWDIHKIWVSLLCQEFFDQGEKEKKMNLPVSPNCDKLTVNIAALQLGFMETFSRESFEILYTLIERDIREAGGVVALDYPWMDCMNQNIDNWNRNWSSLKFAFINDLLSETACPRRSVLGDEILRRKKKKKSCCYRLCWDRERRLYNLTEFSSTV